MIPMGIICWQSHSNITEMEHRKYHHPRVRHHCEFSFSWLVTHVHRASNPQPCQVCSSQITNQIMGSMDSNSWICTCVGMMRGWEKRFNKTFLTMRSPCMHCFGCGFYSKHSRGTFKHLRLHLALWQGYTIPQSCWTQKTAQSRKPKAKQQNIKNVSEYLFYIAESWSQAIIWILQISSTHIVDTCVRKSPVRVRNGCATVVHFHPKAVPSDSDVEKSKHSWMHEGRSSGNHNSRGNSWRTLNTPPSYGVDFGPANAHKLPTSAG